MVLCWVLTHWETWATPPSPGPQTVQLGARDHNTWHIPSAQGCSVGAVCRVHGVPLIKGAPWVQIVIVTYYTIWLNIRVCHSAKQQIVSLAFVWEEQVAQWQERVLQKRAGVQQPTWEQGVGRERPSDWVPGDSESHEPARLESSCETYMP